MLGVHTERENFLKIPSILSKLLKQKEMIYWYNVNVSPAVMVVDDACGFQYKLSFNVLKILLFWFQICNS